MTTFFSSFLFSFDYIYFYNFITYYFANYYYLTEFSYRPFVYIYPLFPFCLNLLFQLLNFLDFLYYVSDIALELFILLIKKSVQFFIFLIPLLFQFVSLYLFDLNSLISDINYIEFFFVLFFYFIFNYLKRVRSK